MDNSTLNETLDWFPYFLISYLAIICPIALMGIAGNCLSIVVFSQARFRHLSINVLLLFLSIFDLLLIVLGFPVFTTGPLVVFSLDFRPYQAISTVYFYPISSIFHQASIWMLIPISFERWVAVCRPLKARIYCTRRRAFGSILVILSLSVLYNLPRFWEFELAPSGIAAHSLRQNYYYILLYGTVGHTFVQYLLPLVVVTVLTTWIILQMRIYNRSRKRMSASERSDQRTAKMLLYVIIVFICCYSMSLILNVVETIMPWIFTSAMGFVLSDINHVLVITNSATTFLFYLNFSTRYKYTARLLLARLCSSEERYQELLALQPRSQSCVSTRRSRTLTNSRMEMVPRKRSRSQPLVTAFLSVPLVEARGRTYSDSSPKRKPPCQSNRRSFVARSSIAV